MNAIVTAGGTPQVGQLLYKYTHGQPKALLKIGDKSMIQYVLDALSQSKTIEQVIVVGLDKPYDLTCSKPLHFYPTQGDAFKNLRKGADHLLEFSSPDDLACAISSDIPGLTGAIIDWIVQATQGRAADVFYYVISRQVMEKRYPSSRRTYYWLKDVEVCGADIHVFRLSLPARREKFWDRLIESRKNAFQQAAMIGFDTLIGFLLRRWTLAETAVRVSKRLDIHGEAVLCPYAEAGMDVDKPTQYEILLQHLTSKPAHV